jgi:hypothetical protein
MDDDERREIAGVALAGDRRGRELLSLAGLVVELRARRRTRGSRRRVRVHGLVAGMLYAAVVAALPVTAAGFAVAVVAVPTVALLLARFDPRAAVAVLVFWSWRLALSDLGAAVDAVSAWTLGLDDGLLLARWCAMCAGIAVAWRVTRSTRAI